jgi:hypothetical protein
MGSSDFAGCRGTCSSPWYFQREQEHSDIRELCFGKSVVDVKLYYKIVDGESLILILCVDDLFLTRAKSLIA